MKHKKYVQPKIEFDNIDDNYNILESSNISGWSIDGKPPTEIHKEEDEDDEDDGFLDLD